MSIGKDSTCVFFKRVVQSHTAASGEQTMSPSVHSIDFHRKWNINGTVLGHCWPSDKVGGHWFLGGFSACHFGSEGSQRGQEQAPDHCSTFLQVSIANNKDTEKATWAKVSSNSNDGVVKIIIFSLACDVLASAMPCECVGVG